MFGGILSTMFDIRSHDQTAPAPGDLEILQRFLNLHEHAPAGAVRIEPDEPFWKSLDDLPPSREMLRAFLVERALLDPSERFGDDDRETALRIYEALHALVRTNVGEPMASEHVATIDRVAQAAGLHPHFGDEGPVLVPSEPGPTGALGRLLAIAFLAELDGRWGRLRECAGEGCCSVFYDRSKNHSGRWHSMQSCGNRNKVRAWRERQKSR